MVKTCPYCEEQKSALKNHVRLTSGSGHGPSGQYPDDFEPSTGLKNSSTSATDVGESSEGDGGSTQAPPLPSPSPDGGAVTVQEEPETGEAQEVPEFGQEDEEEEEAGLVAFTEEEFENVFDAAYDAGRADAEAEAGLGLSGPPEDEEEEDDVVEVEAVEGDAPEDDEETDESTSSGGLTLGRVFMWIVVLPLLAVVGLVALAAGANNEQEQNQNDRGPAFGGGQQTVDVPTV